MELETIKDRVLYLIHELNLSVAKFERTLGWSVGYVSTIKESFKPKKAKQIKKVFKNVNINFIMTGKGQLFKTPVVIGEDTYQSRFKKILAGLVDKKIVSNQSDLAKKLGYNPTYFSLIANNRNRVPKDFVAKLQTIDPEIDGEWLLNDPISAESVPEQDNQQSVLDAVNALPDTTEEPIEEAPKAEETPKAEEAPKAKRGRKPGKATAEEKQAPAAEEKPAKRGRKPKDEKTAETKAAKQAEAKAAKPAEPKAEKPAEKPAKKAEQIEIDVPLNELLIQNRMLISEVQKQGSRMDILLDMLKNKI